MTDLDLLIRAALADAVAPAPPFAAIERRHRLRRTRHVMTAAVAVVAVAAAGALAGQRLGTVAPASGDLRPFDGFRTDDAARAGFGRCVAALPRTLGKAGPLVRDDVEGCFREQGYQPPPAHFVEPGYHHWPDDAPGDDGSMALGPDWPGPCQPQPLPGDPAATVLLRGEEGGKRWSFVAYEGAGGTVCVAWSKHHHPGIGSSWLTPRFAGGTEPADDDTGPLGAPRFWENLAAGSGGLGDGRQLAFFWAPVGPEVTRARVTVNGTARDVTTVASPLAPDRRFVVAVLPYEGPDFFRARYGAVLYDATGREVGRLRG